MEQYIDEEIISLMYEKSDFIAFDMIDKEGYIVIRRDDYSVMVDE